MMGRKKQTTLSAALSGALMALFLFYFCPVSFGEELVPVGSFDVLDSMETVTHGFLQDISFEPAYIWLAKGGSGASQDRIAWLFGKTLFFTSSGDEMSPREFLERYKGHTIVVGVKKNEISASVVMHIES